MIYEINKTVNKEQLHTLFDYCLDRKEVLVILNDRVKKCIIKNVYVEFVHPELDITEVRLEIIILRQVNL